MSDQQMILILIIAFFLLGCSFSCNRNKEDFTLKDCLDCLNLFFEQDMN